MIRFLLILREIGVCFPGKRPLADVWALDTAAKPYEWRKLEPEGEGPPPCMYVYLSLSNVHDTQYHIITYADTSMHLAFLVFI